MRDRFAGNVRARGPDPIRVAAILTLRGAELTRQGSGQATWHSCAGNY